MPHNDGSNGARARSARIRAAHEYEATELDAMCRRRARADLSGGRLRALKTHLAAVLGGKRGGDTGSLAARGDPELLVGVDLGE
jgi:hypothetical protein